jgi:hypothetical protein
VLESEVVVKSLMFPSPILVQSIVSISELIVNVIRT